MDFVPQTVLRANLRWCDLLSHSASRLNIGGKRPELEGRNGETGKTRTGDDSLMGKGWKARDPRLDRMVAVKLLKTGDSARFIREARAVAALNHPNICQICEAGPDHLLMEYIEGKPLRGPSAGEALRIT